MNSSATRHPGAGSHAVVFVLLLCSFVVLSAGAQPTNDNFGSGPLIIGTQFSILGSNEGATREPGEPNHLGRAGGTSIWYRWMPTNSGSVTLTMNTGFRFSALM